MSLGVLIAIVVAIAAFVWLTYNRLVAKRLATENSWSQIDVALRRRHDLIPTLAEAVTGYASHERRTLRERHRGAQRGRRRGSAPPQRALAESRLARATDRPSRRRRGLPAARGDAELLAAVRATWQRPRIRSRSRAGSTTTRSRPTTRAIQVFPAVIVARLFGFERRAFFDAPAEAEATPAVDLTRLALEARGAGSSSPARRCSSPRSALAPPALARSSDVVDADVELRLAPDCEPAGQRASDVRLRRLLRGLLPRHLLAHGERITDVRLSEDGRRYEPGGNTMLGSHDRPGSSARRALGGGATGSSGTTGPATSSARTRSPTASSAARSPTTT